ncbi:protein of unknown function DUF445 [Ferroglobus placidus DSM 10642]|uniref:DUF445 domain-containing protein n=1 Tax=Ferroglobus placidus (strain DSM 10642 / AEDII12DO) TaxID=589924 RepID=D3RZR7_FERPA|nr:DUF445 family protein [Ferroglobus placidus]ADC65980.1 protein of unknown function DUF445 [Ferroglobus placidus DSM 10642]
MDFTIFFIPPLLGAFIGYFTNFVAVKLLFHPKEPKKVLFLEVQGLIPSRANEIAKAIVEGLEEFVTEEDFKELIRSALRRSLRNKIGYLSFLENYGILDRIADYLSKVVDAGVEYLSETIARNVELREVVKRKVEEFSSEEAERFIKQVAGKELKFIEVSGAALGFLIGCLQSILLLLLL